MANRIIPVEPASGTGDTVLIQVQKQGSHELDLRLIGCEGEAPYATSFMQSNISKLRHKFKGSDEEWTEILSCFLLQKQHDEIQPDLLDHVDMVYTVRSNVLALLFRQDIQGIKVILGEIILLRNDNVEIYPFEWAQASARAHRQTLKDMGHLKAKLRGEQDMVEKLKAQLEDFIRTKNETEHASLQLFMNLLNEKKKKIRDQNRLLAGASVQKSAALATRYHRVKEEHCDASPSRILKRKAPPQAIEQSAASNSDSDKMEIDLDQNEEPGFVAEGCELITPNQSDAESEDESEEPTPDSRGRPLRAVKSSFNAQILTDEDSEDQGVPRSLPFGNRTAQSKSSMHVAESDNDDQTESEEL